jgi:hypothetical protein
MMYDTRLTTDVLEQFAAIYEITQQPEQAIDQLTLTDLQIPLGLPELCQTIAQTQHYSKQYKLAQWEEAGRLLQQQFKLTSEVNSILIKPRCQYQLMVDTGTTCTAACGDRILNQIFQYTDTK